jgi:hypothetical protein
LFWHGGLPITLEFEKMPDTDEEYRDLRFLTAWTATRMENE